MHDITGLPWHTGNRRVCWPALPAEFRRGMESLLGAEVVDATSQPGGFSEGLASLLSLRDGRRVFVKAASSRDAPWLADVHQREIAIAAQLAALAGFLLRIAATAGPAADQNLVDMATALGLAATRWLRDRLRRPA